MLAARCVTSHGPILEVFVARRPGWEANDTQEEATGPALQGPDMTGGHVGESITQHGEEVMNRRARSRVVSTGHRKVSPSGLLADPQPATSQA